MNLGRTISLRILQYMPHRVFTKESIAFKPKKALLLAKLSRYDYERDLIKQTDGDYIFKNGLDTGRLLCSHQTHHQKVMELQNLLCERGLDVCVVDRKSYTKDKVDWADVIFTGGGDGTFLLGASKIFDHRKPIIGVNTDPKYSCGVLCLPKWCTSNLPETIDLILNSNFCCIWRQRLCATLTHPKSVKIRMQSIDKYHPLNEDANFAPQTVNINDTFQPDNNSPFESSNSKDRTTTTILPWLALNEVFVGEVLSARVSEYHISVDNSPIEHHKSSGVVVCTGSGSTSWNQHLNRLYPQTIQKLFNIAKQITSQNRVISVQGYRTFENSPSQSESLPSEDILAQQVALQYNQSLTFNPEHMGMLYSIRDPICNELFKVVQPTGFASCLHIRSLMYDAHLVFDGAVSFPFNYGSVLNLSIRPADLLCCIQLRKPS